MSYRFENYRQWLQQAEGLDHLKATREFAREQLRATETFCMSDLITALTHKFGAVDGWQIFAAVDELVRLDEIAETTDPEKTWGQHKRYTRSARWPHPGEVAPWTASGVKS